MLQDMQQALRHTILANDGIPARAGIISGKLSCEAQLDIHRVNTHASLVKVLQAAYPVICRLVGESHFNHAAVTYINSHPPRRPQLSAYGWRFAKFLSEFEPAAALPYLPDLARLEWARNLSYFAADAAPFDPAHLEALSADGPDRLTFTLHPAARLVASPYPIQQIWDAAEPNRIDVDPFDPFATSEHVLITRPTLQVTSQALSPGDFTLVLALGSGATLQQAANAAVAIEPELDLQQVLFGHFAQGTFRAPSTTRLEEAIQ